MRIADLPPCGRRERETIGGKLPTVLYVRVSSSYHGKVVLKITAVLLKNSTALLIKQACLYEKQSKFSIPIRTLCGLCVSAIVVVCCRCVLHRLCSTTCMRPCKALGHTRPATVPGLSVGLPPLDPVGDFAPATPFLNKQEVFRQTKKSMRFKHRFFIKLFIT